jgi:hypothetical protein
MGRNVSNILLRVHILMQGKFYLHHPQVLMTVNRWWRG